MRRDEKSLLKRLAHLEEKLALLPEGFKKQIYSPLCFFPISLRLTFRISLVSLCDG